MWRKNDMLHSPSALITKAAPILEACFTNFEQRVFMVQILFSEWKQEWETGEGRKWTVPEPDALFLDVLHSLLENKVVSDAGVAAWMELTEYGGL
jgi:hypothetical protein